MMKTGTESLPYGIGDRRHNAITPLSLSLYTPSPPLPLSLSAPLPPFLSDPHLPSLYTPTPLARQLICLLARCGVHRVSVSSADQKETTTSLRRLPHRLLRMGKSLITSSKLQLFHTKARFGVCESAGQQNQDHKRTLSVSVLNSSRRQCYCKDTLSLCSSSRRQCYFKIHHVSVQLQKKTVLL